MPLTATAGFADLARLKGPSVVLVVGLCLGAINHALIMRRSIPDLQLVTSPFHRCR